MINETRTAARIGEVVDASSGSLTAQCYQLYNLPPLGSLVSAGNPESPLYAVVNHATTSSLEPGRRPLARGQTAASEEAIYQESPQLEKLLRSEFSALVVGYKEDGGIRQRLPPVPAHIHSFVYSCSDEDVRAFSQELSFLSMLLSAEMSVPAEEVIIACLRRMALSRDDGHAFLVSAGKALAGLLPGQFSRLRVILEALKP